MFLERLAALGLLELVEQQAIRVPQAMLARQETLAQMVMLGLQVPLAPMPPVVMMLRITMPTGMQVVIRMHNMGTTTPTLTMASAVLTRSLVTDWA